jgi:hypothetical protein
LIILFLFGFDSKTFLFTVSLFCGIIGILIILRYSKGQL